MPKGALHRPFGDIAYPFDSPPGLKKLVEGSPPVPLPSERPECSIDWRTLDPSEIQGANAPLEELRCYRENISDLRKHASGCHVVISESKIVAIFTSFTNTADFVHDQMGEKSVLVKKIVSTEPSHSLGGVIGCATFGSVAT